MAAWCRVRDWKLLPWERGRFEKLARCLRHSLALGRDPARSETAIAAERKRAGQNGKMPALPGKQSTNLLRISSMWADHSEER